MCGRVHCCVWVVVDLHDVQVVCGCEWVVVGEVLEEVLAILVEPFVCLGTDGELEWVQEWYGW